jgi:hypothetical protein
MSVNPLTVGEMYFGLSWAALCTLKRVQWAWREVTLKTVPLWCMCVVTLCNIDAAPVVFCSIRSAYTFSLWLTLRSLRSSFLLGLWRHRARPLLGKARRIMSSLNYMELCRLCLVKERVSIPIFEGEGDVRQIFLKIAACLPVKVSIRSVTHAMSEIRWNAMLSTFGSLMANAISLFGIGVDDADVLHCYSWTVFLQLWKDLVCVASRPSNYCQVDKPYVHLHKDAENQ